MAYTPELLAEKKRIEQHVKIGSEALYLTKTAAKKLGWVSGKDNLGEVAPGRAIGGSQFENREGRLPAQKGRTYFECDVNVVDGHRGSARLVYSNDGLIYYTEDHYNTFEEMKE